MENGFDVVRLGAGSAFEVTDVVYTSSGGSGPILDPFGTGRDYTQVEGIATYRDVSLVNVTHADPSNVQPPAAIAMYVFDFIDGKVGQPLAVFEGDVPGQTTTDALAGVKLWGGGPVQIHELEPGIARVYTGSNEYGTVVEFELRTDEAIADLIPLAYWHDGTHFTPTTDVRPYDDGDPEGRPIVLVSRYHQTIGLIRASDLTDPD